MSLPVGRAGQIMDKKDHSEALGWCNAHRYSEGWSIIDGAIVIYNLDSPPWWLPETDDNGNTGGGQPPTTPERTAGVAVSQCVRIPDEGCTDAGDA